MQVGDLFWSDVEDSDLPAGDAWETVSPVGHGEALTAVKVDGTRALWRVTEVH